MEANVKKGTGSGNYQNYILTLLVLAVNVLLLGFCFDFYYDLNDDTMMLDIMAGAYSEIGRAHVWNSSHTTASRMPSSA